MTTELSAPFASVLRSYRLAAGLSQAALADRASLSLRAVSDLERGRRRRPHPHTVRNLATALHLTAAERARLVAAGQVATVAPRPTSNLPLATTSFIGRERQVADVTRHLARTRLLTLTGAGGVGKTRLALQVASAVQAAYPGGVYLVDLAALTDPALVPSAVASVLAVRDAPDQPLLATLVSVLAPQRLLLMLDNCEHLLDAVAGLADALLRGCPAVTLLATSREPLGVAGEVRWRVPSLAVPAGPHLPPLAAFIQIEAVRLFAERAACVQPDFAVTARNAPAVARICARLDGIPLAIELAAARVRLLTVEEIAARLDDCLGLLTGGSRTALPRQQTLRAALEWSEALLTADERALLRRLAVFAGGWTLAAAEAICGEGLGSGAVLDRLTRLVDLSLVVAEAAGAAARYRLLETVRQFAMERLHAAGEVTVVRERHRDWYVALAEQAEPALEGRAEGYDDWLSRWEIEQDNLRAALAWSLDTDPEAGLRLAGCVGEFWRYRLRHAEGGQWLETLLARAPGRTLAQARALFAAGRLYREYGVLDKARPLLGAALNGYEALGDRHGMAQTLSRLVMIALTDGDEDQARALLDRTMALYRDLGDRYGLALSLGYYGWLAVGQGDYGRARALLAESASLFRALGRTQRLWRTVSLQGIVARLEGDFPRAREFLEECARLANAVVVDNPCARVDIVIGLGDVARSEGDERQARAHYQAALAHWQDLELKGGFTHLLDSFGMLDIQHGAPARGVRLMAIAANGLLLHGYGEYPGVPREREAALAAARAVLGEAAFAAAWAEGSAWTLEQAVTEALSEPTGAPAPSMAGHDRAAAM